MATFSGKVHDKVKLGEDQILVQVVADGDQKGYARIVMTASDADAFEVGATATIAIS